MSQLSLERTLVPDQAPATPPRVRPFLAAAYPRHYLWFAALAALDILVTTLVLSTGGNELNALARWALGHAGIVGLVAIKAATLSLVLLICEYLGRHSPKAGLRIAEFALIANSAAVGCGLIYLTQFTLVLMQWV